MPYCRRCGVQLEENARFCHKCGTQVVTFALTPAATRQTQKRIVHKEIIALVGIVAVAVLVSVFAFSMFYQQFNFNPANDANQTNVNKLSFNFQAGTPQVNVSAQSLSAQDSLITAFAGLLYTNLQPLQAYAT